MRLELAARVTDRDIDIALSVEDGETVALLGPNGAGKSTLLGLVAGTVRPDAGSARLGERTLFDTGAPGAGPSGRVWLPPHRRGVTLLAQDPLLFPHLSVRDNVAFGPRSAGRSRRAARDIAETRLAEVDATDLGSRRPGELSGGQAQRVAIARALACEPGVLLLDEPMRALDATVAPALRALLRRVLTGRTAVIVSHDALDAVALAGRAVLLAAGRVVDVGPTARVLARPRTRFLADLVGLTLLEGRAEAGTVSVGGSLLAVDVPAGLVGAVLVATPPARVGLALAEPAGSADVSVLPAVLESVEPRGELVRVRGELVCGELVCGGALAADLPVRDAAVLDLQPGRRAWFTLRRAETVVYSRG
ncbi:MAG: ABC transporter ATP-binding protein [Microbacteriaceae bacterium]